MLLNRLIYSGAGMLLFLSNQVAEDLGFKRYVQGEMADDLVLPQFKDFIDGSKALMFDRQFLRKIAKRYGYDLKVLDHFVLDVKDPKLIENDSEESGFSIKPLLVGRGIFIFIYAYDCYKQFNWVHL